MEGCKLGVLYVCSFRLASFILHSAVGVMNLLLRIYLLTYKRVYLKISCPSQNIVPKLQ